MFFLLYEVVQELELYEKLVYPGLVQKYQLTSFSVKIKKFLFLFCICREENI